MCRGLFRLVWVVLAAALAGCEPTGPDEVRLAVSNAPLTLDPRFATDAASARIVRLLYRSLVEFDDRSRPVPGLARWEAVSALCYRFTLGAGGRTFHDGSRLAARDVQATYDAVLDPAAGSPLRGPLAVIERVDVVDDDTVEFYLSQPDPLFPGRLGVGVMPAARLVAGHAFEREPVGSGPFTLVGREGEASLRLRRIADGLVVSILRVPDPTMRALKLVKGEVDLLQGDLPPELAAWLAGRPGLRVERAAGTTVSYLAFNLTDPVTGHLAVRQAVAGALDRTAIARRLLRETARPAAAILPPEHWAGPGALEGPTYDPARARARLEGLGYGPGRRLRLDMKTSSDPLRLRIATVLQYQLGAVGIDLDVRSYDWATFYADVKAGRFQTCTLSWVALRTPDIFRHAFHSASVPPVGANRGRYRDPVADDLVERAERARDEAQQAALFRALQARLLETLPYVPLWLEDTVLAARAEVAGYRPSADGGYDGLAEVVRVRGVSR